MFSSASFPGLTAVLLASRCLAQTMNCVLTVPPNPLTAEGLATPYKMTGCNQIDFSDEGCFVEAGILDPATGDISIYSPLVINQDQDVAGVDFIQPVVPTLPENAVVGVWFGSNADTLTLTGATENCVNGDGNSVFGQFAYCNTPAFFTAADAAVSAGLLKVPAPGSTTKAATVQPCPVTRDFRMVDMDPSDNVDSTYLLINGSVLAQNTPANAAANSNATEITNGSDNVLLNAFLAPALGCTSFTAPSITTPSGFSSAMVLNELQSTYYTPAGGPALVPLDDDFTVIDGSSGAVTQSLVKTNLYRAGVGQSAAADTANASGTTFCQRYADSGIWIAQNEALFSGAPSPAPAASSNLFTFMANRFATSFGPVPALGCQTIFGLAESPVSQTMNGDDIVTAATINTQTLQDILDGTIQPGGGNTTSNSTSALATSSATALSSSTTAIAPFGNLSTTNQLVLSTFSSATAVSAIASTSSQATTLSTSTTSQLILSTSSSASAVSAIEATSSPPVTLSASTNAISTASTASSTTIATTVVKPTAIIVEVVTFFEFVLSLGGLPPGVTSDGESFIVLEETYIDLASAASAACLSQFNTCSGLAGAAFGINDCADQQDTCTSSAATASPTASTPKTLTASATVPTTVVSSTVVPVTTSAASAAVAIANAGGVDDAVANAAASSGCLPPVTSMVTVTVTAPAATTPVKRQEVKRVNPNRTAKITHW